MTKLVATFRSLPLHLHDATFYLKETLNADCVLQWAGQGRLARLDGRVGRRLCDAQSATVSGHRNFHPDDKELLGELRTQNLRLTDTPRRHGDPQTLQLIPF